MTPKRTPNRCASVDLCWCAVRTANPFAGWFPPELRVSQLSAAQKPARDILDPHPPDEGGGGKREPPEGKGESGGGGLTLCSHPFYLRRLICKPGYSSRPQSECNIESDSPDFPIGEIIVLAEVKTPHPEQLDRAASGLLRFFNVSDWTEASTCVPILIDFIRNAVTPFQHQKTF